MDLIYKPALDGKYDVIRSDYIAAPGLITEQILNHITDDDLAVIDYTGLNSNVMYEAAIRHISKKLFIQIKPCGEMFPFDIKNLRAIEYDPFNLSYPEKLREDLKKAVSEINSPGYKTPEILKYKFDLDQIIKDPEKFVELIKRKLIIEPSNKSQGFDEMYHPSCGFGGMGRIIKCPKCSNVEIDYGVASYTITVGGIGGKIYKCRNCGFQFQF